MLKEKIGNGPNTKLFADDIVLVRESIDELNTDLDLVIIALEEKGLKLA